MASANWKDNLEKFGELSGAEQRLFVRAAFWLLVARVRLAVVPFRKLTERLSGEQQVEAQMPDPDLLQRIGRAVATAANHVPWRSDCFPQTIAGRSLLKRYGIASTIHFGVERIGEKDLAGHAWLSCGETVVTGNTDLDRYTEIHRFSS